MYRSHFGFTEKPFRITPSARFLYPSETHDEGRARILYGIREARGFVVVTGNVGLGKTTVLLSVLEELEDQIRTALIFNPVEDFEQLLRMIAFEFDLPAEGLDQVALLQGLNGFLVERLAAGESCVVLIDEAQNLSLPLLEKLRTLNNLQTDDASLLQIVMVGQPELMEKMEDPRLRQLRQRVGVWHEITPLAEEDTREYVFHRLRLAGAARPQDILSTTVTGRVHALAGGVPRLVNQICDTALVIAYARNADRVEVEHVEEAAAELRIVPPATPSPPAVESRAPEPAVSAAPAPSPRTRRWPAAVGMILVMAIVAGAILGWTTLDWRASVAGDDGRTATETAVDLPSDPVESPELTPQTPEPEADVDPSPVEVSEAAVESDPVPAPAPDPWADFQAAVAARATAIEGRRSDPGTVYGVHLGSFRTQAEAAAFARGLVERNQDWAEPFYVDTVDGDPVWYRVLAGGFGNSGEARRWVRTLRDSDRVDYAQLTRLPASASRLTGGTGENR